MENMDGFAMMLGYGVMTCGGVLLIALLLGICANIVSRYGFKLWGDLQAVYRLESMRHYMQILVKNGRTGMLNEVLRSETEGKE